MYIYIYICVCVCVCFRTRLGGELGRGLLVRHEAHQIEQVRPV